MTPTEVSLARSWKAKGQSLHTIAKLLRRDRKSLRPYTKNKGKKLGLEKRAAESSHAGDVIARGPTTRG